MATQASAELAICAVGNNDVDWRAEVVFSPCVALARGTSQVGRITQQASTWTWLDVSGDDRGSKRPGDGIADTFTFSLDSAVFVRHSSSAAAVVESGPSAYKLSHLRPLITRKIAYTLLKMFVDFVPLK